MAHKLVVHCKQAPYDVYVGRGNDPRTGKPPAFSWGNPFVISPTMSRMAVIMKYSEWLHARPELLKRAKEELAGKVLGCYCAPEACHGDVLALIANGHAGTRIDYFEGPHRWLSNFYPSPIKLKGLTWPSVEHAYQAMKTTDRDWWRKIAAESNPGKAKRMGQLVPLRPDWDRVKLTVMKVAVTRKFAIPELRELLLETGDLELIEGNHWNDQYWGVCNGRGLNHLGRILMEVRAELRQAKANMEEPCLV